MSLLFSISMCCVFKGDDVVDKREESFSWPLFSRPPPQPPSPSSSDSHTLPRTHTIVSKIVHVNPRKGVRFPICHFRFVCFIFAGARAANQEHHSTISNIYTESNNQDYCKINKKHQKQEGAERGWAWASMLPTGGSSRGMWGVRVKTSKRSVSIFTLYNRCSLGSAAAFPARCKLGARNRRWLSRNVGRRRCQQSAVGWWCRSAPSRCCCRCHRPSWAWLACWVTAWCHAEVSVCDGVVDTSAGGKPAW